LHGNTSAVILPTGAIGSVSSTKAQGHLRINGGCNFVDDPALDSRLAQPLWLPLPSTVVRLSEDDDGDSAMQFSLWRLPGRKNLLHDGRKLHLTSELGSSRVRIALSTKLREGGSFAFLLPAGTDARAAWAATSRLRAVLSGRQVARPTVCARRPTPMGLLHMRALQALDGTLCGASQREIAVVLFGAHVVAQKWHADGELRARIRYLIHRAYALMNGGYRRLLDGGR
jgi:hypothetical protein